ncbi:MAG: helix-turn-helix transcriptional regulator [Clostridia bacterium]|nr:helix-turn-helix transcriptional regulator [Clostridia bacterium]
MIKFKTKVILAMREMTQKDLWEATGVRPPTISSMCTGTAKHIPKDVLDKMCKVLQCQPGDLLEYVPDKEPAPDTAFDSDNLAESNAITKE